MLSIHFYSDISMTDSNLHYGAFLVIPTHGPTLYQSNSAPCRRICFLMGNIQLEDLYEDFINIEPTFASPCLI